MLHDPAAWSRIASHLDEALDLEPEARASWLAELERQQPDIARELRAVLEEREALDARGFLLDTPYPLNRLDAALPELENMLRDRVRTHGDSLPTDFAESLAAAHRLECVSAGMMLGPWRLVREIGHGGMSSVWLAERGDGHFQREVAVKLPFEGSQAAQMAERFKRERHILATLTHPNIARLYDAGVTDAGQAYLAMEYVKGTPLTRFCDAGHLGIRARLKIFLEALAAVEFAHTHLVLHRDLKPSNILVTEHGRVVLLDFGIAQLLSSPPVGAEPQSETTARAFTPDYASPEDISGGTLGTTADVFSLGVVLYELLVGGRPFGEPHGSRRGLEEAILKQNPLRPSQFALTNESAVARHSTVRKLQRALKGDLDAIVLKALEKAPGSRYQSIAVFARDLANYLDKLPVDARPSSVWYRSRRFVARYQWQVAAASVAVLSIVIGGAAAVGQARETAHQRDRALVLASRNRAINDFMDMLIAESAASEKPVTVAEMIARSEKLALEDSAESKENRAAILATIARLHSDFGDTANAMRVLERALALLGPAGDSAVRAPLACMHAVHTMEMGQLDAGLREIDRELAALKADPEAEVSCLSSRYYFAVKTWDVQNALHYSTRALERFRDAPRQPWSNEAPLLEQVGTSYRLMGNTAKANHYYGLAMEKYVAAGRVRSPGATILANAWALSSSGAGVPKRALGLFDERLRLHAESNPGIPPAAALLHNRARALEAIGRYAEASKDYEQGRQISAQVKIVDNQAACLLGLASVAEKMGNRAAADRYLAELTAVLSSLPPADYPFLMRRTVLLGQQALADGKLEAARAQFDEVLGKKRKNPPTIEAELGKAEVELLKGSYAAAKSDAQAALNIATTLQGGLPHSSFTGLSWLMLGRVAQARGETDAARDAFALAEMHLAETVGADHSQLRRARELLAATGPARGVIAPREPLSARPTSARGPATTLEIP